MPGACTTGSEAWPSIAVFVSPLRRARQTCLLAGFAERAVTVAELTEWDYGDYEGLTTDRDPPASPRLVAVPRRLPGRRVGRGGRCPADRVIARLRSMPGHVLLFGHGHFFRVLAARWVGLPPGDGVASCSARRRSASWATSTGCRIRPSASGTTIVTPYLPARHDSASQRPSSVATEDPRFSRRTPSHENATSHRRGTQGEAPAQPAVAPANAPRTIRMRAGRILRDARCLLRPAPGLRPCRPSGEVRRPPALRGRGLVAPRPAVTALAEDRETYERANPKQVYYLSMEFLIGRSLANNIMNLRVEPFVQRGGRARGSRLGGARRGRSPTRAGQRRPRPAGRLLPRLDGDAPDSRRSVTACGTSTGSSARRSTTAGRSSTPTTGSAGPTRGRSSGPRRPWTSGSIATSR